MVEKPGRHILNQMLKVNVTSKGTNQPLGMCTEKNNIPAVRLLPKKAYSESNQEEPLHKPKLKDILQSDHPVFLENVRVVKDKG